QEGAGGAAGGWLPVAAWLAALHLEQYAEAFERSELRTVWDCRALTDEGLTRLGVLLPGHRKRILLGVQKAFAEAALPQPPPRKPVPMKRHIFRPGAGTAVPAEPPGSPPLLPHSTSRVPIPAPHPVSPSPLPIPVLHSHPVSPSLVPMGVPIPTPHPRSPFPIPCPHPVSLSPLPVPVPCSQSSLPIPFPHPLSPSLFLVPIPCPHPHSSFPFPIPHPMSPSRVPIPVPRFLSHIPTLLPIPVPHSPSRVPVPFPHPVSPSPLSIPRPHPMALLQPGARLLSAPKPTQGSALCWGPRARPVLAPFVLPFGCPPSPPGCGSGASNAPLPSLPSSYIYQKRWVKLDADYLRYFDSEKDAYSKRFIPVSSISRVASVGDQKFEVVTTNRNFVFRAESDAERNEWMQTLQQAAEERKGKAPERTPVPPPAPDATEPGDKSGFLELRGFKHKLFVAVAGDKVFLYKNSEDYRQGIGITYIEMNVGNVKEVDRRGFDLTTPYRIFSFSAESEQEKEEWVEAMRHAVAEALSNSEVAERIWALEPNRFCADCGSPQPDWASINLCVVICKRCAGEHRGLGPGITKVRSLKMDRKVWTEELIQLFHHIGNAVANQFWAANVPPSEAIGPGSSSQDRRRFLIAKYREGKYRRYHPLFGNQEELDRALCAAVTTSDLAETQALVFCGAAVTCATGDPQCPVPLALAEKSGQRLQMEFLLHNKTSETPRLEVGGGEEKHYSVLLPCVTHNGFLYKTPSMAKPVSERKGQEEFSRRWCTLQDGVLSYYENDRNAVPNGEIKAGDIVCLVNNPPHTHGIESTFEVYIESERLYLFGLDCPEAAREWLKSIAKSFVPPHAEELLSHDFERIGRLLYKGGLNLERAKEGWFALAGSTLYVCFEDSERHEALQLRKLQELSIQGDNEVLVLVERRRALYIQGERRLDFLGWVQAIQKAAGSSGDTLSEQQLTEGDVPMLVDRCIDYITQCGLTSEGIYRKSGQNSKTTSLLEVLRRDARSVRLKEGEHHVDDVANTLKRFFRDLGDGLFTRRWSQDWLRATALEDEEAKIGEYRRLLDTLPTVNRATLKALINHLFRVQRFSGDNQMNTHNLAIVFGPTLFQTDGKDYKAGRVVEDLISHYVKIFNVNDQEMKKQQDEITAIMKMREAASSGTQQAGDFICTVYLEEKRTETEQHVKIPATMTAEELTFEILDRRKIVTKEKDYWSCFEVNEREEAGRLPSAGKRPRGAPSPKKQPAAPCPGNLPSPVPSARGGAGAVAPCPVPLLALGKPGAGREPNAELSPQSHKPEKEWPVRNLRVYLGIKKKLRPPTCWGFTVFYENEKHEKQQWYLCCDTQADLREWFATFLHVQHGGALWPSETCKVRASRRQQDARLGNISLIPLRGNESEMRSSVAAFATDPLTLLRNV
uniref:ArfGAP with RhoGAP domain, ankyrin repeat and PH domain 1 n=1 Tax=Cairina moschata TaxID=8855 RepID=A0A8C3CKW2_CAIMO